MSTRFCGGSDVFQWIVDLLWGVLSKLGEWLLDIVLWILEWLYELVNTFIEFITEIIGAIIELAVNGVLGLLPDGWVSEITAVYRTNRPRTSSRLNTNTKSI